MISELFLLCAESMHIAKTKEIMSHFGKIRTRSSIKIVTCLSTSFSFLGKWEIIFGKGCIQLVSVFFSFNFFGFQILAQKKFKIFAKLFELTLKGKNSQFFSQKITKWLKSAQEKKAVGLTSMLYFVVWRLIGYTTLVLGSFYNMDIKQYLILGYVYCRQNWTSFSNKIGFGILLINIKLM